ncbi:hypothetical protein PASLES2_20545 [Pseudomonas aeruginosa]|uniref:hypothetical protein n=1 Tax=Pseudomonas aeruginosa TaxID=287 RepID=UPI0032E96308
MRISDVTFALFALKARGEPQRHLVRDAETLRQRLLHVPGVKKVNIIGEQAERIFVEFSHERLATLGIGPAGRVRRAQRAERPDPRPAPWKPVAPTCSCVWTVPSMS